VFSARDVVIVAQLRETTSPQNLAGAIWPVGLTRSLSCARATRAGLTAARRPPRLSDEALEGAMCGRRAAKPLTFPVPGTARVSARAS
jgi:hypothetical protein